MQPTVLGGPKQIVTAGVKVNKEDHGKDGLMRVKRI